MIENRSSADSHIITYRPDIDGLRAIAVLSVIIFHLQKNILPNGYLGVDIFFVLSGYLITSIIWREISAGDFSIVRFYDRRIRRIMPALLAVLLTTILIATILLLPIDFIGFAKSLLATLGFVANFYFWRDTNYFSRIAEEKPLLHLWSLGVEEQFYLIFPLVLLLLIKKSKQWALMSIAGLCVLSLILNMFAIKVGADLPAFYLLPTRAWELGAGAFIALLPSKTIFSPTTMAAYGYIGGLMILLSITATVHVGIPFMPEALLVVTGTTLLIYSGLYEKYFVNHLLSWNGLVFLGLISYSLYLWHWPIIVFIKYYLVRDLTIPEASAAFSAMLVLAILSWRYVERPFRRSAMPIQRVRYIALIAVVTTATAAGAIISQSGFPKRLNPMAAQINAAVGTHYRCAVSDYLYFAQSRACVLELPSRNPNDADIVLLGNSHAQMWAPMLQNIIHSLSLKGLLVPANGCLPTYAVNINSECVGLANRNISGVLNLKKVRLVVIGTTWDDFVTESGQADAKAHVMTKGLDETINRLVLAKKRVILIGPLAIPKWDVASIVSRNLAFSRVIERPLYESQESFQKKYQGIITHFEKRNDIEFVRPDLVQCTNHRCNYLVKGHSLFADDNHLAAAELPIFQTLFEVAVKKIFTTR